jgi:D-aminopeptidase
VNKLRVLLISILFAHVTAADPIRARDLGIPFDGTPGPLNAITDVEGVTVGHVTIIKDLADNRAVRTGVTAVFPRGRKTIEQPVFAGPSP